MQEINVAQIQQKFIQRQQRRTQIFEKILGKCYTRINTCSESGQVYCIFPVPDYIFGEPTYNLPYCAAYIIYRLRKNGFDAQFYDPNVIVIKWTLTQPSFEENQKQLTYDMPKLLPPPPSKKNNYRKINDFKPIKILFK